jgi:hypothetical protein
MLIEKKAYSFMKQGDKLVVKKPLFGKIDYEDAAENYGKAAMHFNLAKNCKNLLLLAN